MLYTLVEMFKVKKKVLIYSNTLDFDKYLNITKSVLSLQQNYTQDILDILKLDKILLIL